MSKKANKKVQQMFWIRIGNSIYRGKPERGKRGYLRMKRMIVCTDQPWPSMDTAPSFLMEWPPERPHMKFAVLN